LVSELKEQARNIRTLEDEISTLKTSRNILFTKQRELQEEIRALRGTLRSLNNSHFALIDKLKRAEDDGR
jgi:predicted  nucleic acid-binding Zn-ribbon protein